MVFVLLNRKLKRYEEQELSMQVLSEFDPAGVNNQLNYVKDTPPNIKNVSSINIKFNSFS